MGCDLVEEVLVDYCLGVAEEPARARAERHLVACRACLESFLLLKRNVETAEALDARPSPEVKRSLRARVRRAGPRAWLSRAGYVVAGGAVAAAILVAGVFAAGPRAPRPSPSAPAAGLVDTARPEPATLHFF